MLEHHDDMIDSMRLIDLQKSTHSKSKDKNKSNNSGNKNPYVKWLLSMGRDNKLVLWKLFDGKIMHSDAALPLYQYSQAKNARKETKKQRRDRKE